MPNYPIDLGKSMSECMGPTCAPSKSDMKDEKHYPSLYLEWEESYDLPDEGTMTVKFKKTSETNRKDKEGNESQTVNLDILSIESVKGGKSKSAPAEDSGDALDKLKNEAENADEDSAEGGMEE